MFILPTLFAVRSGRSCRPERTAFPATDLNQGLGVLKMRIAVTTQGEGLSADVEPRFGRAPRFLIVDTETMSSQVVLNGQSLDLPRGAGIQAAQNVLPHKPDVVLTGNCGPKAFRVLRAAGVKVVVGVSGRIADAVKNYMDGKYQAATEANVEGHWV
jgi:predicted Fe-Mo cluster-binding NifX family protein